MCRSGLDGAFRWDEVSGVDRREEAADICLFRLVHGGFPDARTIVGVAADGFGIYTAADFGSWDDEVRYGAFEQCSATELFVVFLFWVWLRLSGST